MRSLLTENFDKTSKFIFDFYDFDRDGQITREDIRIVLSYVSLSVKAKNTFNNDIIQSNTNNGTAENNINQVAKKNFER